MWWWSGDGDGNTILNTRYHVLVFDQAGPTMKPTSCAESAFCGEPSEPPTRLGPGEIAGIAVAGVFGMIGMCCGGLYAYYRFVYVPNLELEDEKKPECAREQCAGSG